MGVRRLAFFGSGARDALGPNSDIDVLVEFEGSPTFDRFMDLNFRLEEILGRRVDLVTPSALKPIMKEEVLRDAVYVS